MLLLIHWNHRKQVISSTPLIPCATYTMNETKRMQTSNPDSVQLDYLSGDINGTSLCIVNMTASGIQFDLMLCNRFAWMAFTISSHGSLNTLACNITFVPSSSYIGSRHSYWSVASPLGWRSIADNTAKNDGDTWL